MKPITNENSEKISRDLIEEMSIESEADILMLINTSEDFIFILDKEGNILNINNAVLKVLKYSEKELLGMNVLDLHPPEQRKAAMATVRELIKGKRKSLTTPFVTKDNEYIYIEAILTRGRWKEQEVFIGISRDITERKRIERLLKESDDKLISLLEYSSDLFAIVNEKFEYEYINEEVYQEVLGYSKEELLGKARMDIIHPEDVNAAIEGARIGFKTGEYKSLIRIQTKEGKWLWIESKGKTFSDKEGNTKAFLIGRNVTDKIVAEQKLHESEKEYQRLISHLSDVLVEIDFKGIILYISPQAFEIFGYKPEELIGNNFSKYVHPKDLPIIRGKIQNSLDSDESVAFEYRGLHKHGHYVTISVKGNKVISDENIRYVGVLRDITDQLEAERRLREFEEDTKRLAKISQITPEIRFWKLIQPKKGVSVVEKTRRMLETVIDNIPTSIYWKDLDLKYLGCNENYADLTEQASPNSIIGKTSEDIPLLAKRASKIHEHERKVINNGVSEYNMVELWKLGEKKKAWFNVSRIPLIDDDSNVVGILVTANDISGRKIAEQKILESERNFRTIADQSLYGMTILQDNEIKYVNQQGAKTLEYRQEEMVGWSFKDILEVIYPEDRNYVLEQNQKLLKSSGDSRVHGYYRVVSKTGKIKYMESATNFITYQGKPAMLTTTQDISERRVAEEKLKESEEKYRLITERANDLIAVINDKYEYEFINEAAYLRGLGYSNEDLLGKVNLDLVHPEDVALGLQLLKEGFTAGEGNAEIRIKNKKGLFRWVEVKGRTFHTTSNEKKALLIARDITERKIIQQELQKSEREISTLLNNIPDVIITVDQEKRIQFVNHMPMSISKEEILGQDIYEFLEHVHQDALKESFKRVFSTGTPETIDLLGFTDLWYKARFIPITKFDEVTSVIFIATNITDTKIASEKLKKTEDRLASILESSGDLFVILDDKYTYEYINEEAHLKTLGYSSEELIGKQSLDILHHEDLEKVMKEGLFQKLAQKEIVDYEIRMKSKQGDWINMDSRWQGFVDEDGKSKIFLVSRDITFRKQAEQKIKDSEEKYRHLFENSPNAIVLVSLKGVVMDCNPATTALFGYEKEDLIDKHFTGIAAYPSELKPQFINSFKNIFQRNYNEPVEFQAFKKDRSMVWVASYLAINNLGSDTFVQAIFQDITQKKKSEAIIQKEIDRLKEIDQIRNDLVRRISHELKTPLISIYSTSQYLLENYSKEVNSRILGLINTIYKGGKRLKLLAENLVNSLRLESRELTLITQNENLVEIVSDCVETFTIFAQERKLFFKKDLPKNLMLEVDKIWLSQAISNMISNAIKNTPERGGVLVKLSEERNHVDISIEDTGVGLTKKEIEKLFEKFGKIERFNEELDIDIEGSGLGLYITREIVQLHGGDIFVYSRGRNQGSTFSIRLYKNNNYNYR